MFYNIDFIRINLIIKLYNVIKISTLEFLLKILFSAPSKNSKHTQHFCERN